MEGNEATWLPALCGDATTSVPKFRADSIIAMGTEIFGSRESHPVRFRILRQGKEVTSVERLAMNAGQDCRRL
jgi:hypothetical protein